VNCGKEARRPAAPRANVEHRIGCGNTGKFGQLDSRGESAGVKLVEPRELLRRELWRIGRQGAEAQRHHALSCGAVMSVRHGQSLTPG